jgi:hypothetical protein
MIGIVGSRNFPFEIFNNKIDEAYKNFTPDSVVTGDAKGIDTYVQEWCDKKDIYCTSLNCLRKNIPSYYLHRDAEIVAYSDCGIIAFWDGKSRGTNFTMRYGAMRRRKVLVVDSKGKDYWFGEVL